MVGKKHDEELDDGQSESGKLAEKFGISIFKAREIIDKCGDDLNCRETQARKAKSESPTAGESTGET